MLGKRVFDIVVATIAVIFLSPLMALIAALLLLQDRGGVLFRQQRVGLGGEFFDCMKFRTMSQDADAQLRALLATCDESRREWLATRKLKKDPRIHLLGALLRRSSLDELPQLFNVIRGDMSIVGPRPIVFEEVERYGASFAYYTAVKPGITGAWQVSGRSDTTYAQRVEMDVAYVRRQSFWADCAILLRTAGIVLLGRGAY